MKNLYFVTEGETDQLVLQGLLEYWLGDEEFLPFRIQPIKSAYAEGLDIPLSNGWRGVQSWCAGSRPFGPFGRAFAQDKADILVIHMDADVAADAQFIDPAFIGTCPPARGACDFVRAQIASLFEDGQLPPNAVLCVPSKDLEAWLLAALHPDVSDQYSPIECRISPGSLLLQRAPHRLVRGKGNSLKKITEKYRTALAHVIAGWPSCAHGDPPRCPEAARFELEAKALL